MFVVLSPTVRLGPGWDGQTELVEQVPPLLFWAFYLKVCQGVFKAWFDPELNWKYCQVSLEENVRTFGMCTF